MWRLTVPLSSMRWGPSTAFLTPPRFSLLAPPSKIYDYYIYTYLCGQRPEAVECVACASRTFPEARVIVADDSNSPMPEQYRDACSYGADIVTTDFDRGRNLNGPEAVRGILALLSNEAADDDIVLKVDPDTALIGRSWLQPMLTNPEIPFSAWRGRAASRLRLLLRPPGPYRQGAFPPSCRTPRFLLFVRRILR